ncbi:hypothetical protein [Arthrobacter sp. Z1-15]
MTQVRPSPQKIQLSKAERQALGAVDLIPAEQLESAAARVRPVFLKSDRVHYESVLNALNSVLRGRVGSDSFSDRVGCLRNLFQQADPDYPSHGRDKEWDGGSVSNKQLSGAWLYGHLLHEDETRRSFGKALPLEEIFVSAMRTVCSELLAVVKTFHLVEELQVKGWLELPEDVFTDDVTITASSWTPTGDVSMYLAPVDTPMPDNIPSDFLKDSRWRPLTEVIDLPEPPPMEN